MTAITLTEKIRVRQDVEGRKHRLGKFTDQGAACELCHAEVSFANGRIELDEALTAVCSAVEPQQYIIKDAPLVTAVYVTKEYGYHA